MDPLDDAIKSQVEFYLEQIESMTDTNVLSIISPIVYGLENLIRRSLEGIDSERKKPRLSIILDTPGGIAEVVERMVNITRHHYREVDFYVPNRAMSAGTLFALSGDRIFMDYYSCLGPIDPQLPRDNELVPVVSYLVQYRRLIELAKNGKLTLVEMKMLDTLDLAELHQYEQAVELSIDLLKRWLTRYKFKDWTVTQNRKIPVTDQMKTEAAAKVAEKLNDNELWHSHGRTIDMHTLTSELNLRINDMASDPNIHNAVHTYFDLLADYVAKRRYDSFVHTLEYF